MGTTTHQTVIVTGGATGLGYAIAEQFVRRGANVFLNGRTEAKLRRCGRTARRARARSLPGVRCHRAGECR